MGLECVDSPSGTYVRDGHGEMIPNYTTDIAAAWEVVLKFGVTISGPMEDGTWIASCGPRSRYSTEHGTSAPHAICLAALKAKGVEVPT
jgi:hypothetical protein